MVQAFPLGLFVCSFLYFICAQSAQESYIIYKLTSTNMQFKVPFATVKEFTKYKNMLDEGVTPKDSCDENINEKTTFDSLKDFFVLTKALPHDSLENGQLNFLSLELSCALDYLELTTKEKRFTGLCDTLMTQCAQSYLSTLEEKEEPLTSKLWRFALWQPYTPRYNWQGILSILKKNIPTKFSSEVNAAPFPFYFLEQVLKASYVQPPQKPKNRFLQYYIAACACFAAIIETCKKQLNIPFTKRLDNDCIVNAYLTPNEQKISLYDICENEYYLMKLHNYPDAACRVYKYLQTLQSKNTPEECDSEAYYKYVFSTCTIPAKIEFYVKQLIHSLNSEVIKSIKTEPTLECIHALEKYGYLIRHADSFIYESNPAWYKLYLLWIPKNNPTIKKNILTIETSEAIYRNYKKRGCPKLIPKEGDDFYAAHKHKIPLIKHLVALPDKETFLKNHKTESPPFTITLPQTNHY